jgi:hypothetical protein
MLTEAKIAFDATVSAIALFDKVYPRIRALYTGEKPVVPSFKIEKQGNEIVGSKNGKALKSVTHEQLMSSLSPDDISHIKMFEKSLKAYSDQIEMVYPKLALLPPIEKAQTELRLKQMTLDMKVDLLGITDFIQKIGFDLEDHYSAAHSLIQRLGQ